MKNVLYVMMLFVAGLLLAGCEKDDPVIPNEEELITTLIYTLTPQDGGEVVVFSFQSLSANPVIKTGTLSANAVYNGEIKLLNELETPVEDITLEVKDEGDDHQFFFNSTTPGLSVVYADEDGNGKPVGIKTTLSTAAAGAGKLTIVLRHMPAKDAEGVADGNLTNAGGESDIEVTFDVNVQ